MSQRLYSIPEAIEVFVTAFTQLKSRTYPYVATQYGNVWVMRDTPDRKDARKIEVITHGISPNEAIAQLRNQGIGWHFICDIHSPEADYEGIRGEYKSLGYRAISTEWLFVHPLIDIPTFKCEPAVRQLFSQADVDTIHQETKKKRRFSEGTRLFSIADEAKDIGWVTSVPVNRAAWVSDLHVQKDFRGKGYGKALMSQLLHVDREEGVEQSVLLASSDGARIYPTLGYQQIGILQMFCPTKRGSV